MGPEHGRDDASEGDDPFEGITLDEDFVRAAPIHEESASDRERAARQANLSRLLADEAAQRANQLHELRRFAPGDEDDWEWDADDRGPRRHRRPLRLVALLVVVAMVSVYVLSDHLRSRGSAPARDDRVESTGSAAGALGGTDTTLPPPSTAEVPDAQLRPDGWPSLAPGRSEVPLGTPGPVPEGGGPHSFVLFQEDGVTPVGYDPCRPIHYVVRDGGPQGGDELIADAVRIVSEATGLVFIAEGGTDEPPSDDRAPHQPERYGDRWAPVLVAWSDAAESDQLGQSIPDHPRADVAGYASSQPMGFTRTDGRTGRTTSTGLVLVTGSVVLDEPDLTTMLDGHDGYARARAIVAHELAHLVGLGHVDDPTQLMHPSASATVTSFAPGDLEGLARLGSLACFPQI